MVSIKDLIQDKEGERIVVLGNEAIARGAIEAGVERCFAYPGTPSTEITETLIAAAPHFGFEAYWSANEKVAFESAYGAALSGLRSIYVGKHVGLNVAADALMTAAYNGIGQTGGAMIIISATDPACHSSQNEQDNRWYGRMANLPTLEPSDAREAQFMIKKAFDLSERYGLPVIINIPTRICHSRSDITLGEIRRRNVEVKNFQKDPGRLVCIPANARKNHIRLTETIKEIRKEFENSELSYVDEGSHKDIGIITAGNAYSYVKEALNSIKELDVSILKLGVSNPLPEGLITKFMTRFKQIIVVEEGDTFLESGITAIVKAHHWTHDVHIYGRQHLITPDHGELNNKIVQDGLIGFFYPEEAVKRGRDRRIGYKDTRDIDSKHAHLMFARPPILCAGCPHRATFYALGRATKGGRDAVFSTDIGCYTLGIQPPLNVGDVSICMGSSLGIGAGLATAPIKEKAVALIGDSTFWHTGLPGLANAVYNQANMLVVIVDNFTTAMTGMQEHPGTGKTAMNQPVPRLSIPDVVKAMGVEFVEIIDAYSTEENIDVFKRAMKHEGLSVIVSRGECMLHLNRRRRKGIELEGIDWTPPELKQWYIDPEVCTGCQRCIIRFGCPAIIWTDQLTDKGRRIPMIDPTICMPCGVCSQVCPHGAIKSKEI